MNLKFVVYLFCITLFSFFSFFKGAEKLPFIFILAILAILTLINYFYSGFYSSIIRIPKESVPSSLFFSSIVGVILFLPLSLGDFSYQISGVGNVDLLLPLGIAIYLLSMAICFFIDAFFNKETANVKKGTIALGSFLFYFGLYFINLFLSIIFGGMHALTFS